MLDSLRVCAVLNVPTTNINKSINGAGPDALPPNVFSLAPAGLTNDTSHLGISPAHSNASS